MKYLYGPVASRRLGSSLGVDILPLKTCSFNCVYCQLGNTPRTTLERREYLPAGPVLDEIAAYFEGDGPRPDYVTFSGSGEPTLHLGLGGLVRAAKERTGSKVAVLTNSSLISRPDVRKDLAGADLVVPSLDAATQEMFERVNRPAAGLEVSAIIEGLAAFRGEFSGELRLEVLIVNGLNDTDDELDAIRAAIEKIGPDSIDVNTVARPPAEEVRPVPAERLAEIVEFFGPRAVAVVTSGKAHQAVPGEAAEKILALLRRRPCSFAEICSSLGLETSEAAATLAALSRKGLVANVDGHRDGSYRVK